MNQRRIVPATMFIASVVGALALPAPARADGCATSSNSDPVSCCEATFSVTNYQCNASGNGHTLVPVGMYTVCSCTGGFSLEKYSFASDSCSCS